MRPFSVLWLTIVSCPNTFALFINQRKFDFLPIRSLPDFGPISTGVCNKTLTEYDNRWNKQVQDPNLIRDAVNKHQQCILEHSTENMKATMSSATVLLGLTPVLLQAAGPSVNEMGLMSLRRPGLTFLLSLGPAAAYPSRMFGYGEESFQALKDQLDIPPSMPAPMITYIRKNRTVQLYISAFQYLVAAVGTFNAIYTSWQLGVASINNFDCTDSLMPLSWTLWSLAIHGVTALSFWLSMAPIRRKTPGSTTLSSLLRSSVDISLVQDAVPVDKLEPDVVSSLLYWITSVMGFVHGTFGVLVFSSLLFVQIEDAATILLRYFASTVACQTIIAFEISGMRAAAKLAEDDEDEKETDKDDAS